MPAGPTIDGQPVVSEPDLVRMRAHRHHRLQAQLDAHELDGLVLFGSSAVTYATGASAPGDDSGRASLFRAVAVVTREGAAPHLFAPFEDSFPEELPADHRHGPLFPDLDDGINDVVQALGNLFPPGARLGTDELMYPVSRAADDYEWLDAGPVLATAKITKSADEVACIRTAQQLTELAMDGARTVLRPGARQTDLSATFLRRIFELGASANAIDPIWQVMAPTKAAGPWTVHGDLAFPTSTTDRLLRDGDIIWVDAGALFHGYASDFGRTWLTATEPVPTAQQQSQFRRWRTVVDAALELCKPGVSGLELGRAAIAANGGVKPWIEHFYLAHGVGTDSAEMPLIGTDLGEKFDEALVLAPGMVVVFEPVIWDDGAAGYRAEDVVAITDDGWMPLSNARYEPYTSL
jgi:Xaa-Pro dipeptidase